MSGAVPPPAASPLERAARVPRPVCPGCGRCGRGDPAPAPRRAPLQAGVARCGAGGRASPGGGAFHHCEGRLGSDAPPPPAARPLGGLPGLADHVLWARVWVCVVCVVSVRCVSWCGMPLFSCPSRAPLSGASVRCCARRVPAVPPSLRASLARLLATPCFFRGFVALYPFLYPSPWHAHFSLPPLWCVSRSLSLPARGSLSLGLLLCSCEEKGCERACGGGGFVVPWHIVIAILGWSLTLAVVWYVTYLCLVRVLPSPISYRVVLITAYFSVRYLALFYILSTQHSTLDAALHTSLATFVRCPSRVRGVTCNILARETNVDQSCFFLLILES